MASATRTPSKQTVPVQPNDAHEDLPLERVAEIQRARMLAAMVEVAAERGASNVTVAHIVGRSGVSRRTFYEIFKDREDCLLAALGDAIEQARGRAIPAYESKPVWQGRVRAALTALLELLDEQPSLARFLVVDSLGAGPRSLELRRRVLTHAIAAVDEGREEGKASNKSSPLTAEGVVGGALSVIHARLLEADHEPLIELVNPLMGMIVLPYLGSETASRELKRTSPQRGGQVVHRGVRDPLRSLDMRLTYRTVRVLLAVGATPGCSNREIGLASGITDQGQISKLLGRLERLELVHNDLLVSGRGAPNAWTLTAKGAQVERAMSGQSAQHDNDSELSVR
jgi:AcrR family transcriptional regulator